jgi:CheY-like chemotaxis protein
VEFEAQLAALRAQAVGFESAAEEAAARQEELRELSRRFEKQRVETIDLAAQLQSAQREIRELSASLAEARLQVKFASAASRVAKSGATKSDFAGILAEPAPEIGAMENSLTEKETKSALAAMRQCLQTFSKTPADFSLLNELHCQAHGFSERARTAGLAAVHRLSHAFCEFTRGLYEVPEQVNPSTLGTVNQTIDFLAALMREKHLAQLKDPARSLIYAVDDDLDNCESIRLAMETSGMRTNYAQDPAIALSELAAVRCDLILLDVKMPGMDGFDLCEQIRELPEHAATPIIFVTGLATMENRAHSAGSGGNDFIAKPFNLYELTVKALTLILKAQLHLA